ncbi:hypothetical protein [Massilia sp. Se16.2.3]|uniref:hypothetical protein n=1 Tax=Massilia sp. Se16.2.3 TaxID=2709303 RepID=UPI001E433D8E|nr:hypothetical protein [Massilia sp. Se16.2.3]
MAAPLRSARGAEHPHLAARFAVRWYRGTDKARVDVAVENDWAYEPDPGNITYDVTLSVDGKPVYAKQNLTHFHHARWRMLAWSGQAPNVHLRHDTAYLIASRALPNYDQSVQVSSSAMDAKWNGPKTEPMGVGQASPAMPNTGGRHDLGILPGWAAIYLLGMDARAKEITLATADLAGSWSTHYRDKRSGLPVSLADYPYMTLLGGKRDTHNPKTGKLEAFPPCPREACKSPYKADSAHQPGFAYLPYLVTGDHYYLEELQFWAMYNVFASNPGYRKNNRGLLAPHQVRGQAWSLRTLGEAAYITPDGHPLKRDLLAILDSNLDWYNSEYSANPQANKLGVIVNGPAVIYKKKTAVAPWQDDFFTAAVGHLAELGFKDAEPLLKYKARFPLERMVGEGACWLAAANYTGRCARRRRRPISTTSAKPMRSPSVRRLPPCPATAPSSRPRSTTSRATWAATRPRQWAFPPTCSRRWPTRRAWAAKRDAKPGPCSWGAASNPTTARGRSSRSCRAEVRVAARRALSRGQTITTCNRDCNEAVPVAPCSNNNSTRS